MSNDGALDAAGGRSAGQVCPLIGIKREVLRIQFVSIDNQDRLVGDHIIPGSPGGQRPVFVCFFRPDAACQLIVCPRRHIFLGIQRSRGQQLITAV